MVLRYQKVARNGVCFDISQASGFTNIGLFNISISRIQIYHNPFIGDSSSSCVLLVPLPYNNIFFVDCLLRPPQVSLSYIFTCTPMPKEWTKTEDKFLIVEKRHFDQYSERFLKHILKLWISKSRTLLRTRTSRIRDI